MSSMGCVLFSNKMVGLNINTEKNEKGWYNTQAIDEMRQWLNG